LFDAAASEMKTKETTMKGTTIRKWHGAPVLAMGALLAFGSESLACSGPPPTPPPRVWVDTMPGPAGKTKVWIGIEVNLFPPTAGGTPCACGILIGSSANPAPLSLLGDGASITITNTVDHTSRPVPEFNFLRNAAGDNGLINSPVTPGYQGAAAGATGFAYGATVDPFTPPTLGPNEIFKLWTHFTIDTADLSALFTLKATFVAGSPGDPDHEVEQFGSWMVPTPGTAMLGLLAAPCLGWRRRR